MHVLKHEVFDGFLGFRPEFIDHELVGEGVVFVDTRLQGLRVHFQVFQAVVPLVLPVGIKAHAKEFPVAQDRLERLGIKAFPVVGGGLGPIPGELD